MTDLDYKDELDIDELDLVYDWMIQAALYGKWAELWAEAAFQVDKLTERRKVKRAQIYSDVKLNPSKYEWQEEKSPTEGFIDAQIRQNAEFRKITKDLILAKKDMNVLQGAKESFYHKRSSLESLSRMTPPEHPVSREGRKLDEKAAMVAQKQALRNRKGETK
jgi:hypothetical protein